MVCGRHREVQLSTASVEIRYGVCKTQRGAAAYCPNGDQVVFELSRSDLGHVTHPGLALAYILH